ncbi:MAG: twin-arginine translocase TatA/TatE family subunit [Polyangiales bacterium]
MFGIGPTELAFFLVIVLLAVGPEKLPTFMRTVGKGVRQVRNASREFKEAIGLEELMREGDPFRSPPIRPPRARPVPVRDETAEASQPEATGPEHPASPQLSAPPPIPAAAADTPEPAAEPQDPSEVKRP